jgi:hypothetical protein
VVVGCTRETPGKTSRVDSVATPTPMDPPTVVDWRGWDTRAGGILVVAPEDDPGLALLVRPDAERASPDDTLWRTRLLAGDSVDLIALDGSVARGRLDATEASPTTACEEWPAARIAPPPRAWGAGFAANRVVPIPIAGLESLSAADSAATAALAARIASAAPESGKSQLAGMPFTVERLHRIALAVSRTDSAAANFGDTTVIAATLFRRLAQEADPREERWFLVAERTGRARNAPWVVRYLEFDDAPEEEADAIALLAAVRVRATSRPGLLIARDGADGMQLRWITPTRDGSWRASWVSARARCRGE